MYILHLSDLHFGTPDNAHNWYNQLAEDLDKELNCPRLDALILSGDIANKSTPEEYTAAKLFLDNLCEELHLQPKQIVIVPGNHDLNWGLAKKAYKLTDRDKIEGNSRKVTTFRRVKALLEFETRKNINSALTTSATSIKQSKANHILWSMSSKVFCTTSQNKTSSSWH